MNFDKMNGKYLSDPAFNKLVNVYRQLLEAHGFLPSELREAAFLAQYMFESGRVEQVIRTQDDWQKIEVARKLMRETFLSVQQIAGMDTPPNQEK